MRVERIIAALRRPLIKRLRMRRSTVIMVGLFVVLAGLQAYHNYNKPPASTTICIGDHCVPATHSGSSSTGVAHQGQATTTTSDPPRRAALIPKVIRVTAPITAGVNSRTVVTSAMRATSSTPTSGG